MSSFSAIANPNVKDLPVYEPGKPIEEVARELGFDDPDDVIKLASNENALGPSPLAIKAMRKASAEMHRYPDGSAYYLKQALSKALGLDTSCILPTNGSNEAISLISFIFLRPGAEMIMADRAFVVYRLIASSMGAKTVAVPMADLTHDLPAMLKAIGPTTRVVFISNPNNPTSTMVEQAEIDEFMDRVPEHVVVCFDEAYVELLAPEKQPDVLKYVREGRNVMILRTFSKTYGLAGLRIGYLLAPPEGVQLINHVRQPFNVNAMAMAAAMAALKDQEHVQRTRRMVADGIRQLETAFRKMGLSYIPAVVNFMLVKVGKGREVFDAMQRLGVIVRPMDGYGLPEYVRVTVGTGPENRRCLTALKKVLDL